MSFNEADIDTKEFKPVNGEKSKRRINFKDRPIEGIVVLLVGEMAWTDIVDNAAKKVVLFQQNQRVWNLLSILSKNVDYSDK